MTRYELWYSEEEESFASFEKVDERNRKLLPADARKIWEVEAETWEEAQIKIHEFMGWEPYKPMNENGSD